jgi:hypothetical protein
MSKRIDLPYPGELRYEGSGAIGESTALALDAANSFG